MHVQSKSPVYFNEIEYILFHLDLFCLILGPTDRVGPTLPHRIHPEFQKNKRTKTHQNTIPDSSETKIHACFYIYLFFSGENLNDSPKGKAIFFIITFVVIGTYIHAYVCVYTDRGSHLLVNLSNYIFYPPPVGEVDFSRARIRQASRFFVNAKTQKLVVKFC